METYSRIELCKSNYPMILLYRRGELFKGVVFTYHCHPLSFYCQLEKLARDYEHSFDELEACIAGDRFIFWNYKYDDFFAGLMPDGTNRPVWQSPVLGDDVLCVSVLLRTVMERLQQKFCRSGWFDLVPADLPISLGTSL